MERISAVEEKLTFYDWNGMNQITIVNEDIQVCH